MTFARIGSGRIRYELSGPLGAPVLVLAGSLGSDLGMWDPQVAALSARHRILRYDSRGHGQSAVPPGPYRIEELGGDVLALLDSLGIARASFCGLSMGGQVGLWLGRFAPGRIDRLVLANTGALIGTRAGWDERIAAVGRDGLEAMADAILARWLSAPFRAARPEAVERLRHMLVRTPAAGYAACCAAVRDADLRADAAGIRAPTLVVAGALDVATPPELGRELARAIPGARYLELPAAHLSSVEAAEAFSAGVARHLEAPGSAGGGGK